MEKNTSQPTNSISVVPKVKPLNYKPNKKFTIFLVVSLVIILVLAVFLTQYFAKIDMQTLNQKQLITTPTPAI